MADAKNRPFVWPVNCYITRLTRDKGVRDGSQALRLSTPNEELIGVTNGMTLPEILLQIPFVLRLPVYTTRTSVVRDSAVQKMTRRDLQRT